ncbi:MAG: SWIM zinc finger family protein, partial [Thermoplasmata archaeon]
MKRRSEEENGERLEAEDEGVFWESIASARIGQDLNGIEDLISSTQDPLFLSNCSQEMPTSLMAFFWVFHRIANRGESLQFCRKFLINAGAFTPPKPAEGVELRSYAIEAQIERRIQRARSERFTIENLRPREVYSLYKVFSHKSRKTYHVEIRDLKERINRCSCPDYETNGLGTCKHIETVLLNVARKAKTARRKKRVQITARGGDIEIKLPDDDKLREAVAPFLTKRGKLRKNFSEENLERAVKQKDAILVITPQAQLLLDEMERARRQAARKRELQRLLRSGEADVDLLLLPL